MNTLGSVILCYANEKLVWAKDVTDFFCSWLGSILQKHPDGLQREWMSNTTCSSFPLLNYSIGMLGTRQAGPKF